MWVIRAFHLYETEHGDYERAGPNKKKLQPEAQPEPRREIRGDHHDIEPVKPDQALESDVAGIKRPTDPCRGQVCSSRSPGLAGNRAGLRT
jgi:hypothetical protein